MFMGNNEWTTQNSILEITKDKQRGFKDKHVGMSRVLRELNRIYIIKYIPQ